MRVYRAKGMSEKLKENVKRYNRQRAATKRLQKKVETSIKKVDTTLRKRKSRANDKCPHLLVKMQSMLQKLLSMHMVTL